MRTYATGEHKPMMRGVLHGLLAPFFIYELFLSCEETLGWRMYVLSMTSCFTLSGIYHLGNWSLNTELIIQKFDHLFIFILCACSYTPSYRLIDENDTFTRALFLTTIWGMSAYGAVRVWKLRKPNSKTYILAVASYLPFAMMDGGFFAAMTSIQIMRTILAWICYAAGFIFYVSKWPKLWPDVFGHHEVYHIVATMGTLAFYEVNRQICRCF
jgi:hemolysin III